MTDTARGQRSCKPLNVQAYQPVANSLAEGHRINGPLNPRQARALGKRTITPSGRSLLDSAPIKGRGEKSVTRAAARVSPSRFSLKPFWFFFRFFSRQISGAREVLAVIRLRRWEGH